MLAAVMLLVSFAWGFVYVGLPFHIDDISPADPATTLAWTGWILGVTSLAAVVSTPFWSRVAARGDPKRACVVVQLLQGIGFVATGLARTLLELFLARLALGAMGSASTFAFMLASRTRDAAELRRRLAVVQAAITAGSIVGPLVGAVAAARLGFRPTFVLGGIVLGGCAALLHWGLPPTPEAEGTARSRRRMPIAALAAAGALALVGSVQESFLAAVLPRVLPGLGVPAERTLEAGGLVLFLTGAATALGGLATPHLHVVTSERRALPLLLAGSSIALAAFGIAPSLWTFVALRIFQSLAIAPVFPLIVARVARLGGGQAIGIINAARIGGHFLGPVAATTILAWSRPGVLYLVLGLIGLASVRLPRQ
jgi:MFS family permease